MMKIDMPTFSLTSPCRIPARRVHSKTRSVPRVVLSEERVLLRVEKGETGILGLWFGALLGMLLGIELVALGPGVDGPCAG